MNKNVIERKVNEIFKYNGIKLKAIKSSSCKHCYFLNSENCDIADIRYYESLGHCCNLYRKDNNSIIFIEVE